MIIIYLLLFVFLIIYVKTRSGFTFSKIYSRLKSFKNIVDDQSLWSYTNGGIPRIIIKTSWQKHNEMPIEMKNVLKKTEILNPDYFIYYFDDSDIIEFLTDYDNTGRIINAYTKLIPGAFKADLFRLCILYRYGGCYSDIGHVMKMSFDDICGDASLVLVKDSPRNNYHGIHNALICSAPKNNFIKECIEKCCKNIENNYYGENGLDITGPTMMGKIYNCHFKEECSFNNIDLVNIGTDNGVKILDLVKEYKNNSEILYITDYNKNVILDCKFPNYYNIMYNNRNVKTYGQLWNSRKVYRNI